MLFVIVCKSKKILLPGVSAKEIKPIALLLKPSNLIIPMLLIAILGQISDNLKSILDPKEFKDIYSFKFYRKIIFSGFNSVSLSTIQALARTLGPELEILSVLNVYERVLFLKNLQLKIILDQSSTKVYFRDRNIINPLELMRYRKSIASQCRSVLFANSVFSPSSIVFGLPLASLDLNFVLESSKLMWLSLGLLEEDFTFLLRKDAINSFKRLGEQNFFNFPSNNIESLKILFFNEIKDFYSTNTIIDFSSDNIVLKGENNLVLLEKELGFIKRGLPVIPKDVFVPEKLLDDTLIRASLDQRRKYKSTLKNIYSFNQKFDSSKKLHLLKNVQVKHSFNN